MVDKEIVELAHQGNATAIELLELAELPLFDGSVMSLSDVKVGSAVGWVVHITFDPKHVIKRWRERIKSATVHMTFFGVVLTKEIIIDALMSVLGMTSKELELLFDPTDKMRVGAAVLLLKMIGELSEKGPSDWPSQIWRSTPARDAQRNAMIVLGFITRRLIKAFFDCTITASEHLKLIAEAMQMTFLSVRAELLRGRGCRSTVVPAQLYHDTITMGLSCWFTARKLAFINKLVPDQPASLLFPHLIGDGAVEAYHRLIRCLSHNSNPTRMTWSKSTAVSVTSMTPCMMIGGARIDAVKTRLTIPIVRLGNAIHHS